MYRICNQCSLPGFAHELQCPACGADLTSVPVVEGDDLTGALIEKRYRLVSFLGEGGMAWVYRGTHIDIGASVAVKLLKPAIAENPGLLLRFKKEATAISALSHPNILSVISSGETDSGIHYMVAEYIQGTTLTQLIRTEGKLSLERSVDIMRQILVGLEEAHGRGIVHRDLKPENIMVIQLRSGDDFCKIVDFGIAQRRQVGEDRLTRQGEIMGTPEFMAPEVIRGEDACPASDLYAAGIIFYEMLTGSLPFANGGMMDILMAHLNREAAPVRQLVPELPQEVENLLTLALIKDPARRISSAGEFLKRLHFGPGQKKSACRTCGQDVSPDQRFCPGCGRLQAENDPQRITYKPAPKDESAKDGAARMFWIPFFGRTREMAAMRVFFGGPHRALEIVGETGVGKATVLAQALEKHSPNRPVARALPDRDGMLRAWWPIIRLISRWYGWSTPPERRALLELCRRLKMEPDEDGHILTLFGLRQDPSPLEFRVRRREMITSVARLLLNAAREGDVWLVFQDVDRYDFLSRQVVERLVALNRDERVRVFMTTQHPWLSASDRTNGAVRQLALEPFNLETSARFCRETLAANGVEMDPSEVGLAAGSAGLPIHLVEGMRLLHEGITDLDRPLSDLVQTRIRNLPGSARRLLQWISTAGGRLSGQFVRESGFLEKASIDAILDCVKHGFLVSDSDGHLELTHAQFSQIILAEMSAVLRFRMQQDLLGHLQSLSADPRQLATCALQAGDMELAIGQLELAAQHCDSYLDDHGALQHLKAAYELTEIRARAGAELPRFVSICRRYGDLLRYTGNPVEAERVLREAMLYCRDGEPDTPEVLSSLARCLLETAPEHAEGQSRRALKLAARTGDPRVLFRTLHDFGQIVIRRGQYEQGRAQLKGGLSLFDGQERLPPETWRLYLLRAICERHLGQLENAAGTCSSALELPMVSDSWLAQARCHEELARIALAAGEKRLAAEHLSRVIAYHRFTGDRKSLIENQLLLAELDGENRTAWAQGAMSLAGQIGDTEGQRDASRLLNLPSG